MNPQVSVVVKSYNHADYVGETIRSILDQSFQDFEIVVTDDGSTDQTADVVHQFAKGVDFPVGFTTHPHTAFQLARCRNEGVTVMDVTFDGKIRIARRDGPAVDRNAVDAHR